MFRIGEFSKIAQVSGSQLRYYDEIGLLKPARIDEWTGYRYYSAQQLPELNRILALKELGLSLDQIERMLGDDVSTEEIRGMFSLKKVQIEQSVQDELQRLRHIDARLRQIEDAGSVENYDIIVKSVPAQPYLSLRDTFPSFDAARSVFSEMQQALPSAIGRKSVGHLTALMHSEMYEAQDIDLELGFVMAEQADTVITLPSERTMRFRTLPAVETMASSIQVGMPQMAFPCRAALATWIEDNGYQFAGGGREVFIVPPRPGKEQETVMEIQYPVSRSNDARALIA
jgi:DNA-binding transcriptional MerR regulator